MIDEINNPQQKLQQQFQQANTQQNRPVEFQRPGSISTDIQQPDPLLATVSDFSPEVTAEQQKFQQEQKKGFKAMLQQAKQESIDRSTQYLMQQVTGGQDEFNQPTQTGNQPTSRQLQAPPHAERPNFKPPTADRPEPKNKAHPKPPVQGPPRMPSMPKFKAPPRPKML